jgi:ATP-dependent Clp protease adaptor protein ClpS
MSPLDSPVVEKKAKEVTRTEGPWTVVVFDDPVNLMDYVTKVLQKVFGYPQHKAEELMLQVHQSGKSRVWSGARERAELYVQQLHEFQLHASLEKER